MVANDTTTSPPNKKRLLLFVVLGVVIATIIITLACVVFYNYVIRGTSGEPADRDTVQKITVQFVSALQDKDYLTAKDMFSDQNRDSITVETLETLGNESPIVTYQSLKVCDFKVFYGESGKHLVGMGLIQYEGGFKAFESMLLQNPDETWQMHGFFLTDDDRMSWDRCK
jgi:hypothetical protein